MSAAWAITARTSSSRSDHRRRREHALSVRNTCLSYRVGVRLALMSLALSVSGGIGADPDIAGTQRDDPALWRTAIALITGVLAMAFDTTIVRVVLKYLTTALHPSPATVPWRSTGYLPATFVSLPVTGRAQTTGEDPARCRAAAGPAGRRRACFPGPGGQADGQRRSARSHRPVPGPSSSHACVHHPVDRRRLCRALASGCRPGRDPATRHRRCPLRRRPRGRIRRRVLVVDLVLCHRGPLCFLLPRRSARPDQSLTTSR